MKISEMVEMLVKLNVKYYSLSVKNNSLLEAFIEENPPLILKTTGNCVIIQFVGVEIWNSEDDERPCMSIDPNSDLIPLEQWIESEVMRVLAIMSDFHAILLME